MSWGLLTPCWNCKKAPTMENPEGCKDAQHVQDGINAIHQDFEGHKGCGNVVMACSNCETKTTYK
jgi:hypothetical protein